MVVRHGSRTIGLQICALHAIAIAFSYGCGAPEPPGPIVGGTIMVKNDAGHEQPLTDGLITWEPIGQTSGHKVSARIQDGVYELNAEDGLSRGAYRVEVMVMPPDIVAAMNGQSPSGPPQKFREIDANFNANSILTYRITSEREQTFDALVSYRNR